MTPAAQLDDLAANRDTIASLEITHIDDLTTTPVPIKPERVEGWKGASQTHIEDRVAIEAILGLLLDLQPVANDLTPELRWKLTFRDAAGKALLELWHHSREPYGRIGDARVAFKNDRLLTYLRTKFDEDR